MNIHQFFAAKDAPAIFRLTKEITAMSFVWVCGSSPYGDPVSVTLPAGTLMRVNTYSNFGDGYSMTPVNVKAFGQVKKKADRWVRVNYADMEYVDHRVDL